MMITLRPRACLFVCLVTPAPMELFFGGFGAMDCPGYSWTSLASNHKSNNSNWLGL